MKKTLLTALMMLGAGAVVYGQATMGTIQWGNNYTASSFRSLIYLPDAPNSTVSRTGQSTSTLETPSGTTVYPGAPIQGAGYTFAFFAGSGGTTSNALVLYASTSFRTGGGAGLVQGGLVTITNANAGTPASFQIRVWNNQGGTLATWTQAEAAWLNGLTDAAITPVLLSSGLGGTDSNGNPVNPATDSGWVSFNTYSIIVPEPTSMTLAGLGAAAMLIFRRRK